MFNYYYYCIVYLFVKLKTPVVNNDKITQHKIPSKKKHKKNKHVHICRRW